MPGVAPSPASTIRYLPCTAPTPRPREPRPLFDDYAECGLAWKQILLAFKGYYTEISLLSVLKNLEGCGLIYTTSDDEHYKLHTRF